MFQRFFRRDARRSGTASALYGAVVVQARAPAIYAGLGVPDTVTGRFEMVVLHTILLIERLKGAGRAGRDVGQAVFDAFCRDMDQSLRELGFGDQAVPRRMKQIGESFYGRAEAYGQALANRAELGEAIIRNVFPGVADPAMADALAGYAAGAAAHLSRLDDSELLAGRVTFPDAAAYVAAGARQ